MGEGSRSKHVIDGRDVFISGHDLDGDFMPDGAQEELRRALFASSAESEREIRAFIGDWLLDYQQRKGNVGGRVEQVLENLAPHQRKGARATLGADKSAETE